MTITNGGRTFGWALEELKKGSKVARKGWTGKGTYIVRWPGYPGGAPLDNASAQRLQKRVGAMQVFDPHIMFFTMDGGLVPWVSSHADLLNEDWYQL